MPAEVSGKLQKRDILFAHWIENAYSAVAGVRQPDDVAAGPAKLALQRLNALGGLMKMPFEKLLENIHGNLAIVP